MGKIITPGMIENFISSLIQPEEIISAELSEYMSNHSIARCLALFPPSRKKDKCKKNANKYTAEYVCPRCGTTARITASKNELCYFLSSEHKRLNPKLYYYIDDNTVYSEKHPETRITSIRYTFEHTIHVGIGSDNKLLTIICPNVTNYLCDECRAKEAKIFAEEILDIIKDYKKKYNKNPWE